MDNFQTWAAITFAVLYGIFMTVVHAAGIIWVINAVFGTAMELTLFRYIVITTASMIAVAVAKNATK